MFAVLAVNRMLVLRFAANSGDCSYEGFRIRLFTVSSLIRFILLVWHTSGADRIIGASVHQEKDANRSFQRRR